MNMVNNGWHALGDDPVELRQSELKIIQRTANRVRNIVLAVDHFRKQENLVGLGWESGAQSFFVITFHGQHKAA